MTFFRRLSCGHRMSGGRAAAQEVDEEQEVARSETEVGRRVAAQEVDPERDLLVRLEADVEQKQQEVQHSKEKQWTRSSEKRQLERRHAALKAQEMSDSRRLQNSGPETQDLHDRVIEARRKYARARQEESLRREPFDSSASLSNENDQLAEAKSTSQILELEVIRAGLREELRAKEGTRKPALTAIGPPPDRLPRPVTLAAPGRPEGPPPAKAPPIKGKGKGHKGPPPPCKAKGPPPRPAAKAVAKNQYTMMHWKPLPAPSAAPSQDRPDEFLTVHPSSRCNF